MSRNRDTSWLEDIEREFETVIGQLHEAIEDARAKESESYKEQVKLKSKIAEQRKLNEKLKKQLHEISQKSEEMDDMCKSMKTHLTIADSDKKRLENARELFQLGKELTGIRFDFEHCSKHPDSVKGYLINKSKRKLETFNMEKNSDALWDLVADTFDIHDDDQDNPQKNNTEPIPSTSRTVTWRNEEGDDVQPCSSLSVDVGAQKKDLPSVVVTEYGDNSEIISMKVLDFDQPEIYHQPNKMKGKYKKDNDQYLSPLIKKNKNKE